MSIVHVGYHKTGTTFLQNEVFPFIEGVNYVDFNECAIKFRKIYRSTTLEFKSYNTEEFGISLGSLYSFEDLIGEMGIGTYNYEIASRLKAVGFKKIIITIRRQDKMVESIYRQYIQRGGVLPAAKYVENPDFFRWSYLNYYDLIERYSDIFGKENVLIFTQEELKDSLSTVLEKLKTFCGASKQIKLGSSLKKGNKSLSYCSIKLLRVINHFTYNVYRRSNLISNKITTWKFRYVLQSTVDTHLFSKIFSKRKFYSKEFTERVKQDFFESNQRLNNKYELNLDKYGYLK